MKSALWKSMGKFRLDDDEEDDKAEEDEDEESDSDESVKMTTVTQKGAAPNDTFLPAHVNSTVRVMWLGLLARFVLACSLTAWIVCAVSCVQLGQQRVCRDAESNQREKQQQQGWCLAWH